MKLFKLKIKKLIKNLKTIAGKNNSGKIVLRHRGGAVRNLQRILDYKRFLMFAAIILKQENIINHSATLALIIYKNGTLSYIISTHLLKNGDIINTKKNKSLGSIILLKNIYVGAILHSLELKPGSGAKYCRAAGNFFQVLNLVKHKNLKLLLVRLKSKKKYLINPNCSGVLGIASFLLFDTYQPYTKAGQLRKKGRRPHVRGVAMNPIDHPHGGNTSGGRCSISIYGILSKGFKTRKKKNAF